MTSPEIPDGETWDGKTSDIPGLPSGPHRKRKEYQVNSRVPGAWLGSKPPTELSQVKSV